MRRLLPLLLTAISAFAQCPDHAFLGCVLRLKAQRVPFERNIMTLMFSIKTEAKLLQTCKAYSSILPCFREKIVECGDQKQRRLLKEVEKALMFMCTPFSLKRQRALIQHQQCVSTILAMPAATGCKLANHYDGERVLSCKRFCLANKDDFMCMVKAWISEQNVCTLRDLENKCGPEASMLYKDIQAYIYESLFPIICQVESKPVLEITTTSSYPNVNELVIDPNLGANSLSNSVPNQIYYRPERRKFIMSTTSTSSTTSMAPIATRKPTVWTKKPNTNKIRYNKAVWKKTTTLTDALNTTELETTTPLSFLATPRSQQVISLIRNLLPENLPYKLSELLENSLVKHGFSPDIPLNTPGTTEAQYTTSQETYRSTAAPRYYPVASTRWRPWYLGGNP